MTCGAYPGGPTWFLRPVGKGGAGARLESPASCRRTRRCTPTSMSAHCPRSSPGGPADRRGGGGEGGPPCKHSGGEGTGEGGRGRGRAEGGGGGGSSRGAGGEDAGELAVAEGRDALPLGEAVQHLTQRHQRQVNILGLRAGPPSPPCHPTEGGGGGWHPPPPTPPPPAPWGRIRGRGNVWRGRTPRGLWLKL